MNLEEDFTRYVAQTSPYSMKLEVTAARGAKLYTKGGRSYTDLTSGIAVANLGYNHSSVVQAIKAQAESYAHTNVYGEHIQRPQVELARFLIENYFPGYNQIFFTNSGTEANELALKMARKLTGRQVHGAIVGGFHGRTFGSMSISWNQKYRQGFGQLLPSVWFPRNEIKALTQIYWEELASVTVELIQGEAGAYPMDFEFIRELKKKCDETGTYLIFDEVQTGFGRTGEMFAQEVYGVRPDITVIGKAMGGGLPLGGVVAQRGAFEDLQDPAFSHVTTFGGNPIACAAGLATVKAIQREDVLESVREKSFLLTELLDTLADSRVDLVREHRGAGFLRGIEFRDEDDAHKFVNLCFRMGIIVGYKLNNPTTIRIAPPLIISESELRHSLGIMTRCLGSIPETTDLSLAAQ